ncbi:MAG: hypothetical protein BZY88_13640 [SAR202 cluster bacterium Io17-Chloro-G9]|nr:MAG: hypothetical protein BZY88_13640 [SAR202 cluster bacterium Io17-Chloro-G9]
MFMIDSVRLNIKAGNGGKGCVSFLRSKYHPKGGPNGGDGGDGGNAYICGDPSLNTLLHLKFNSTIYVESGVHGKGKNQRGGNGAAQVIKVPLGTEIWQKMGRNGREFVADVTGTSPHLVAEGGHGGLGNARFVSATNQEPVLAEKGEQGEQVVLFLELKLLADVGLLARPNAGKSTLISRCSAAKPRVAEYPFTTVEPVLGVVGVRNKDFVMMEVPGLLEGAHQGVGLGQQFLRHAERARVYVHILDGTSEDPVADFHMLNNELKQFNPALAEKPQIIGVNKIDVTEVRESQIELAGRLTEAAQEWKPGNSGNSWETPVMFLSAVTGEGVPELLDRVMTVLDAFPKEVVEETVPVAPRRRDYLPNKVWVEDGVYVVQSESLQRLAAMADTRDTRVIIQLWREMERRGLARELVDAGIEAGDTIRIGEVEVEWF